MKEKQPNLFAYALLLPLAWFAIGAVASLVAPNARLGAALTIAMFIAIAVGISWHFLNKNGRLFTNNESWRMVIYCSLFAIILESWVLLAAMAWPELFPNLNMTWKFALIGLAMAAVLDTLAMVIGFRVTAPRFLSKYVEKDSADAAVDQLSQDDE